MSSPNQFHRLGGLSLKVTCHVSDLFRNISAPMAAGLTINPVNPWDSLEKIRDLFHQNLILESEEKVWNIIL